MYTLQCQVFSFHLTKYMVPIKHVFVHFVPSAPVRVPGRDPDQARGGDSQEPSLQGTVEPNSG